MGEYDALMAAPLPAAHPAATGGEDYSALMAAPVASPPPPPPTILESAARGALQGASFGFADEIAGALGSAFGPKTYVQARDESRKAYEAAKAENPKAYLAGEVGGGLASAVVPGGVLGKAAEGGAAVAEAAPTIGRLALRGAASGAAYGGAQALGDSTADLTKGDFHGAIADTLRGAAIGGVTGGIIGPAAHKLLEGAGERQAQDILDEIAQGEGKAGGATVTAKKLLAKDKDDIVRTIVDDPELGKVIGKPAREALPVVAEKLEEVGSKLDPNYDVVQKAAGPISMSGLADYLTNEAKELGKTAFNEQHVKAVEQVRDSLLTAYAPKLKTTLERDAKLSEMGIDIPAALKGEDVAIPLKQLRKDITRLQSRASLTINPLNPGEDSIIKADMASMLKRYLDAHLDIAAEGAPDVATAVNNIRQINTTYSALANIRKALEQRGWKEATGSKSMGGHFGVLGTIGAGALGFGHMGPAGAISAAALAHFAPGAARALSHEGNAALARLAQAAASGAPTAHLAAYAIQTGVPRAAVMRVISGITQALAGGQQ